MTLMQHSTAEQIRRQQVEAYWRLREQQQVLIREFFVPAAKLWGEKMREAYPELYPSVPEQITLRETWQI